MIEGCPALHYEEGREVIHGSSKELLVSLLVSVVDDPRGEGTKALLLSCTCT